jgi:hypothetical protein
MSLGAFQSDEYWLQIVSGDAYELPLLTSNLGLEFSSASQQLLEFGCATGMT